MLYLIAIPILIVIINYSIIIQIDTPTNSNLIPKIYSQNLDDQNIGNRIKSGANYPNFTSYHDKTYYQIKVGDVSSPIIISQNGSKINNVLYDFEEKSITLIMNPNTVDRDKLLIDIPRIILDSHSEKKDNNFTVLVNDQPAEFLEITDKNKSHNTLSTSLTNNASSNEYSNNTNNRKLMIEFEKDAKIIEIIGTETVNTTSQSSSRNNRIFEEIFPIRVEDKIGYINFKLVGGNLKNIYLEKNSDIKKALILDIIPYNKNGELVIDIPRIILDSHSEKKDNNFTVLVNDQPAEFLEITDKNKSHNTLSTSLTNNASSNEYSNNTNNRKLMIEFEKDAKIIEIIGTETVNTTSQSSSSENMTENLVQNKGQILDIIVPIVSSLFGIAIAILYFLYRKGKLIFKRK